MKVVCGIEGNSCAVKSTEFVENVSILLKRPSSHILVRPFSMFGEGAKARFQVRKYLLVDYATSTRILNVT
jgi:hypothetical protein